MSDSKILYDKTELLNIYLSGLTKSPAQKTKEWYDIKQLTIGGSEVATVLGINPFESLSSLIAKKVGVGSVFNGNIATRWGNLFEYITKKWGEIILKMPNSIKEAGSIQGIIPGQRYSPDGLGVVKLKSTDDIYEYFVVLFEFKSPLRSLPNGKIPKYYIPQVQTGLLSIPLADTSIFINNCYRKCSLSDLKFNSTYDTIFHDGDAKKRKTGLSKELPYACGIICFYQTVEEYYKIYDYLGYASDDDNDEKICYDVFDNLYQSNEPETVDKFYKEGDIELLLNTKNLPMDLGAAPINVIDRVLELHDEKRLHAIYYPIIVNSEKSNKLNFVEIHDLQRDETNINPNKLGNVYLQRFIDRCDESNWCSVGYLPWKLMRSDIIIEDRDDAWQQRIETPIKDTLNIITEILTSPDPAAKYDEKYNKLDVSQEYLEEMANDMNNILPIDSLNE
jgi:hypothetical protein